MVKPDWKSRVMASLAYLLWLTLPLAVYWRYFIAPPPAHCKPADALTFCLGVGLMQPMLSLLWSVVFLRGDFERQHGKAAASISLTGTGLSLAVVATSLAAMFTIIGLLLGVVLFYIVLPLCLIAWWGFSTLGAIEALAGNAPNNLLGLLPQELPKASPDNGLFRPRRREC